MTNLIIVIEMKAKFREIRLKVVREVFFKDSTTQTLVIKGNQTRVSHLRTGQVNTVRQQEREK